MIMITGATGNVGRHLVKELSTTSHDFKILARDLDRVQRLTPDVEAIQGDLGNLPSLESAFRGVHSLFLLTQGIGVDYVKNALAAARSSGVRHIVFLSSYAVSISPLPAMGRWHDEREKLILAAGVPATFLRPGGFMTNALDWLPMIRQQGCVIDAIGPGRLAPIDPGDIAAVAAVVLTNGDHIGKNYVLTGDDSLTVGEQVQTICEAIGCTIPTRAPHDAEEVVRSRFPNGAPKELADALLETLALMRSDTVGIRTDAVRGLLGRRPQSFRTWCAVNAQAFRDALAEYKGTPR